MTINKLHVIKKDDMYIGEIILDGKIVETIPAHLNASNCARTLNARVTQVATLKNIQLPRLVVSKPEEPIYFELTKNSYKIIKKAKTDTVKKETPDAVTQTAQRVPPHPSPLDTLDLYIDGVKRQEGKITIFARTLQGETFSANIDADMLGDDGVNNIIDRIKDINTIKLGGMIKRRAGKIEQASFSSIVTEE